MSRKRYVGRSAFTLIELLLVLVILGVLAAVVVPKLTGRAQDAKIGATKTQISSIKGALDMFEQDNGHFPQNDEGLRALVEKPSSNAAGWKKYLETMPVDGWGNPFVYRIPGTNGKEFDIISYGPDAREGGGDDITN
jgi:general secretion pathway protein G